MQSSLLLKFQRQTRAIEATRARANEVWASNRSMSHDLDRIYEGLFLKAVTEFESFIESLFINIMLGRCDYARNRATPRMVFKSTRLLRDVMMQDQRYLAWLPYEKTISRAQIFLKDGRPFTDIPDNVLERIRETMYIRNAVAHSSDYAKRKFEKHVIGNRTLLPRERKPARFLQSTVRVKPDVCRFQIYMEQLNEAASELSRRTRRK